MALSVFKEKGESLFDRTNVLPDVQKVQEVLAESLEIPNLKLSTSTYNIMRQLWAVGGVGSSDDS